MSLANLKLMVKPSDDIEIKALEAFLDKISRLSKVLESYMAA
jgi:hypothetical protein